MSEADRQRWENKHRTHGTGRPRATLEWIAAIDRRERSQRPLALDLACGNGRHCDRLLAAGYTVVAADIARTALDRIALPTGADRGRLHRVQMDVDCWPFRAGTFDLIAQIDFLDRARFDDIKLCTKPGGHVLIDTFMLGESRNAEGPGNPEYLLRRGELEDVFGDWELLRTSYVEAPTARCAMLARRPH